MSSWEDSLECGRKSAFAGLHLHSESQILKCGL